MKKKEAIIIGAGLGGLSCGLHLLSKGFRVRIFEKNAEPGGRAARFGSNGFTIDMGPTLLLMPDVLESVFQLFGRSTGEFFRLKKLEPGYRIFFGGGKTFDMTTDTEKLLREIRKFDPGAGDAFARFRDDVRQKFEYSRRLFIERPMDSVWDLVRPGSLEGFFKIRPFGNAFRHALRYFKNPELAAVFSCQTLYLGESPFRTPSLYNLLSYVEFTHGVWYPDGGMSEIPRALACLFIGAGGEIRCGTEAKEILAENQCARGVRLADGSAVRADCVVSNRDIGSSYLDLLPERHRPSYPDRKIRRWRYGASCVLLYWGLRKKAEGFLHHNILLPHNLERCCRTLFSDLKLPDDPMLYMCVPTKTDAALAPEGFEVVYILALVPNLRGPVEWKKDFPHFRQKILDRLARSGLSIAPEDIELEKTFLPEDFESRYGSLWGNAFGLSPFFFQSAAFRPRSRSPDIRGLYHTGASTHPGSGVPMVLLSGRLVAQQIERDFSDDFR